MVGRAVMYDGSAPCRCEVRVEREGLQLLGLQLLLLLLLMPAVDGHLLFLRVGGVRVHVDVAGLVVVRARERARASASGCWRSEERERRAGS